MSRTDGTITRQDQISEGDSRDCRSIDGQFVWVSKTLK